MDHRPSLVSVFSFLLLARTSFPWRFPTRNLSVLPLDLSWPCFAVLVYRRIPFSADGSLLEILYIYAAIPHTTKPKGRICIGQDMETELTTPYIRRHTVNLARREISKSQKMTAVPWKRVILQKRGSSWKFQSLLYGIFSLCFENLKRYLEIGWEKFIRESDTINNKYQGDDSSIIVLVAGWIVDEIAIHPPKSKGSTYTYL